jgi:quercetin dioxygenase-like cupin family protein
MVCPNNMSDTMPNQNDPFVGRLADSIAYQADSIVSKILGKAGGGSATLFAFSSGQELSEHTAPFQALIYVVEGEADVQVGGRSEVVSAGDLVTLPANVPHGIRATTDFKMLLVMLRDAPGKA